MSTDGSIDIDTIVKNALAELASDGAKFNQSLDEQRNTIAEARNRLFDKIANSGDEPVQNAPGVDELVVKLNQYPMIVPAVTASVDKLIADIGAAVENVLNQATQSQ